MPPRLVTIATPVRSVGIGVLLVPTGACPGELDTEAKPAPTTAAPPTGTGWRNTPLSTGMQPALDDNYRRVAASAYAWPAQNEWTDAKMGI